MQTFQIGERMLLLEEVTVCGIDRVGIRVARPTPEGVVITIYSPTELERLCRAAYRPAYRPALAAAGLEQKETPTK